MGESVRDVKQFACRSCDRAFTTALGLRSHSRVHNKVKTQSHVCKRCNALFNRKKELNDHTCQKTAEKPWPCNICALTFADLPSLRIHFDSHAQHDKENELLDGTMNYSMLDVTLLGNEGPVDSPRSRTSKGAKDKKKAFRCHLCDDNKSFRSRWALSTHVQVHYAKKNELYSCETCKLNFREHIALRKHLGSMDHTRMKMRELQKISPMADFYECSICNKEFADQEQLFKHSSTHSVIFSDLKCDLCCKTFKLPRLLQVHLSSKGHQLMERNKEHDAEKSQYQCLICEKMFSQKTTLKAHLRNHVSPQI